MNFSRKILGIGFVFTFLLPVSIKTAPIFTAKGEGAEKTILGKISVDGSERPVFLEKNNGVFRKYFLDANGSRIDVADYRKKIAREARQKYGNFGKRLFDTLQTLQPNEGLEVQVEFTNTPIRSSRPDGKLTREEADAQSRGSIIDGIDALERRLGKLQPQDIQYHGKPSLRLWMSKQELLDFKNNPRIRWIELSHRPGKERVLRQAALEESFMGGGWNSGGLHFTDDCGEGWACGSGTTIGVLEQNPIWDSDSADHLDGEWFIKRPGTPVADRHPHGLWTSGIIRNSGPGLSGTAFNGGGAYNASVSLGYPVAPESTMADAYDWLVYYQRAIIINHSWQFPRYLGGDYESEANEFERQMDIVSAGYPYVLNVEAAGNSGDTADGGWNDACVDSSAVYNSPGWSPEECQRVGWWNHNGLIVGSVDNDSARSPFSAFRNGPENDEAPHVVVRGSGVELPWMSPYDSSASCPSDTAVANASGPLCGTSYAAPTVAALAAHLSSVGGLAYYPEALKGIIMASATSRPIDHRGWRRYAFPHYPANSWMNEDMRTGVGVPDQPTADSIVRNRYYGSNFSAGVYGFKTFYIGGGISHHEEWDTITVSHPQGGVIHFYLTWLGNPSNITPGMRYSPDDMELYVEVDSQFQNYSVSYQNSTEYVSYPIFPGTSTTFLVRRYLYSRFLDEDSPIYGSLVWTYTPPPMVEIHSPLDSTVTNQNLVPVNWSVDGLTDTNSSYESLSGEGPHAITRCYEGLYFCDSVTVFLDQTSPEVIITDPGEDTTVSIDWLTLGFTVDGQPRTRGIPLNPGVNVIVIDTLDAAGNRGADTIEITYAVPVGAPVWPTWSHLSVSDIHPSSLRISWTPAVDDSGVSAYRIYREGVLIDSVLGNTTSYTDVGLYWNHSNAYKVEAGDLQGNWSTDGPDSTFSTSSDLPPDPTEIAPPLNKSHATMLFDAAEFLFNDTLPIQTGMEPGIIDTVRAAVVRGIVKDIEGNPLEGVSVSVRGVRTLGSTVTREDGGYDLMVNGGGWTTLKFGKPGFLPVSRRMETPWRDFVRYPEITLTALDTVSQTVYLDTMHSMQVFQSSVVTDSDGVRRTTLLIPTGTLGYRTAPGGISEPVSTVSMRATEYTVGETGPKAMPADLPPSSGYTYAVEFSADEAAEAGTGIEFTQPIISYVENFVGIPVGWSVPAAYYDRRQDGWVPEPDGRVVKVHSVTGGKANLIIDETGNPADSTALAELAITDEEREKIASLFSVGDSLWRVPVRHFSAWDFNWGKKSKKPKKPKKPGEEDTDENDEECGSVIGCQSQILGESFPISGTPFTMKYSSDRVKGRRSAYRLPIQLTDSILDPGMVDIQVEFAIAGRYFVQHLSPDTNSVFTFEWDGRDAYGREVQGKQAVRYAVGYGYATTYLKPSPIAASFGTNMNPTSFSQASARTLEYEKQVYHGYLGTWDNSFSKLGGWSIDAQHAYDISGEVAYFGNGRKRKAVDFGLRESMRTVAGNGEEGFSGDGGSARNALLDYPGAVDIAADGSIYFCDMNNYRIRKVDRKGIITTVAGNGGSGYSGDGGDALSASFDPLHVDAAPDGGFYITDATHHCVRKVDSEGRISTVAGTGISGYSGDGGAATSARLDTPFGVAAGPDGSLYIADFGNNRIRKIGLDGIIHTVAGDGQQDFAEDSVPALQASFIPHNLALAPDGSIFVADQYNSRIFKVGSDGLFTTFAGNGSYNASGDGGPALDAGMQPFEIKVAKEKDDYSIYFADWAYQKNSIRKIDPAGIISTVAGGVEEDTLDRENRPATIEPFNAWGMALSPDGGLYITDNSNHRLRCVRANLPRFGNEAFVLSSGSGHVAYTFDAYGRHLRTRHGLTGGTLLSFEYDESGFLTGIIDGNGNETTIERTGQGYLSKIVSPYGQETRFEVNDSGFISRVVNPAGEERRYIYSDSGLLTEYITPRGYSHTYAYDTLGRLSRDDDPAGGYQELTRTETGNGILSTLATAMGRTKSYLIEKLPTGGVRKVNTGRNGLSTEEISNPNGRNIRIGPDSVIFEVYQGPDPRFGMQSPIPDSTRIVLPSGLTSKSMHIRYGTFADPGDPLTLQSLSDTMIINGRVYTQNFDSTTRVQTYKTPEGRLSTVEFDSLGRIIGRRIGNLDSTRYYYDARGRLESIVQGTGPEARERSYEYDELGNLQKLTDEADRVFEFEYDLAGRATRVLLPDSQEVNLEFDSSGNLTSLAPPGKPAHAFAYNAVDMLSTYHPPDLGPENWATGREYNLDKQVAAIVRPESTQIDIGYDSAGRMDSVHIPDAAVRYSYNALTGKIDSILSRDSILSAYVFDGPLLKKENWSGEIGGEVSFAYNPDFRIDSLGVNGTSVAFEYDEDGLITRAADLDLVYEDSTLLLRKSTVAGLEGRLAYNGFGEVVSQSDSVAGGLLYSAAFQRDKLGRIVAKVESVLGTATRYDYQYDAAGRLSSVLVDSMPYSIYRYDENGNRTSRIFPGDSIPGTYDDQDRLIQYGNLSYVYTRNGELSRLISGSDTTAYNYDALGNLLSVRLPAGAEIEYVIDGRNRRVGKKVDGILKQGFLYQDQLNPVAELDSTGNAVARFVYASKRNVPDLMIKGGITYRIISDHLGSPRLVVNTSNDSVVQRMDYDEFGNLLTDTHPGFQPFGFAGGLYDGQTYLTRFGARDYDAWSGRWPSKDPIGFRGGLNQYAYVHNNPINRRDPRGLQEGLPEEEIPRAEEDPFVEPALEVPEDDTYERGSGGLSDALPEEDNLRNDPNQDAIIQIAKNAKKTGCGFNDDEGETIKEWGREYKVDVRGPEAHPDRTYTAPHYHVGPVDHIPAR